MKNDQHNHTRTLLYLIQVRWFFVPLFQLLPIIGFLAPPLSKSHVVLAHVFVTVSNSNMQKCRSMQNRFGNMHTG